MRLNSNAVPVLELKHAIISKEFGGKLPKPNHDLLLQNKATGEMYRANGYRIPKNTSIECRWIPGKLEFESLPPVEERAVILDDSTSPEDAQMLAQATQSALLEGSKRTSGYYGQGGSQGGPGGYSSTLPPGYKCNRCGSTEHFIRDCPTNGDPAYDVKQPKVPSGIPRSALRPVVAQEQARFNRDALVSIGGTLRMKDGTIMTHKNTNNNVLTNMVKKPKKTLSASESRLAEQLKCPHCHRFLRNAVVVSCCYSSFCQVCIEEHLPSQQNSSHRGRRGPKDGRCPNPQCGDELSEDVIKPNNSLRRKVAEYLFETNQGPDPSTIARQGSAVSNKPNEPSVLPVEPNGSSREDSKRPERPQVEAERGSHHQADAVSDTRANHASHSNDSPNKPVKKKNKNPNPRQRARERERKEREANGQSGYNHNSNNSYNNNNQRRKGYNNNYNNYNNTDNYNYNDSNRYNYNNSNNHYNGDNYNYNSGRGGHHAQGQQYGYNGNDSNNQYRQEPRHNNNYNNSSYNNYNNNNDYNGNNNYNNNNDYNGNNNYNNNNDYNGSNRDSRDRWDPNLNQPTGQRKRNWDQNYNNRHTGYEPNHNYNQHNNSHRAQNSHKKRKY